MMFGAALLLFCGVMVPSLAQQEPNVSSERVNCTQYASQCAHLCPVSTCSKNKTLYIQVRSSRLESSSVWSIVHV